jgi:hypothetical protein
VSGAFRADEGGALREALAARGWARLAFDPALAAWAAAARPLALRLAADPALHPRDLRCGGTWFAGVNVFPNGPDGAAEGVPPLPPALLRLLREALGLGAEPLDRAQISVTYPGYPRHGPEETEAAFRFRRDRDAAHVDGVLREGPERRRFFAETHRFVLGLPLTPAAEGASPLVVWEGSHHDMRAALAAALDGLPPERWALRDVTETYVETRRRILATRPRLALPAQPGEATLVHRLALHGVAPWTAAPGAGARAIAYFRPEAPPAWSLSAP